MENYSREAKIELCLRVCAILVLVLAACLIGTDTQTKPIVYTYKKTAEFRKLNALVVLVYLDAVAAAYNLLQISRHSFSVFSKGNMKAASDNKKFAWACFLLDQVMVYCVFAVNTAAIQAAFLALTGSKAVQWMKLCNRFSRFCVQMGGGLVFGYIASFVLVAISSMSAFNLFRLYSPTRFMQLKSK